MGGEVKARLLLDRLGVVVDEELGGEVLGVGALGLEQRQVIGTCSHAGNWNGNSQEYNIYQSNNHSCIIKKISKIVFKILLCLDSTCNCLEDILAHNGQFNTQNLMYFSKKYEEHNGTPQLCIHVRVPFL